MPSPYAGPYLEDIPGYPFVPGVNWKEFMEMLRFCAEKPKGVWWTDNGQDRRGCLWHVRLIRDVVP